MEAKQKQEVYTTLWNISGSATWYDVCADAQFEL